MKRRIISNGARLLPIARCRGRCASFTRVILAALLGAAVAPSAWAQIASLDKGHQLLLNSGLQIWGLNTDMQYSFNYNNLAGANMNAVMWGYDQSSPGVLSSGQHWAKWIQPDPAQSGYTSPANSLNSTEQAHYADLQAIQVGDEQQADLENSSGYTKQWFDAARSGHYFDDKLLYINSTFVNSVPNFLNFIAAANPDAISWDAYPFGTTGVYPYNWLGKSQIYRRAALGSYIGASGTAPRPYGLWLQTYHGGDGARDPGELEMRWQQFTAWTLGYTFVDAFTAGGGNTSLFVAGNGNSPNQPIYNQFKETSRQSKNLGPALTHLISYGYGPNIVLGQDPSGATNPVPIDWPTFNPANAPTNQQYLKTVSALNLGTKNNGHPGDVYVGFFNPLLAAYGDPIGEAYFMVTNALGAYLQDPTLTVSDCTQQITMDFDFGASGINSLQRLRRSDGQVEVVPLTHLTGNQYRLSYNLEGGTGDLFKYNDGTPFVGIDPAILLLYWDSDGTAAGNNIATGAGLGGSGTWDTSASRWFNGSSNVQWTSNQTGVFAGTAGTVTLAAPQSAAGLQFKKNGYTLAGSTLTVGAAGISVDSGMTATINSALVGSTPLTKTGAGTLVLGSASNSYTGGTMISGGTLRVTSDDNLGTAPASLATNITLDGGTLQFGANFDLDNNRGIVVGAGDGTIDTQGFTNPSGYTQANGISGSGDLTKKGSGTFFMNTPANALNTGWTGNLILKEGIWKVTERGGLPYNANADSVYHPAQITFDGGTLQLAATFGVTSNYRGMTVAAGGGTIDTQGFSFSWGGPLIGNVPNATLTKTGSGSLTFSTATAAGTGPGTYSGNFQVNGGALVLSGGGAMGDLAAMNLANTAGVSMTISGAAETIGSLAGGGASGGNVVLNAGLVTGGNNNSTSYDGVLSSVGSLTKTGTGTMTLTGANTYGGGTTVSGGTLRVNNTSGSGTGSGAVTVSGGTLGGAGTISGPITVNSGGHIAPGASAGTLSTSSSMILNTGSVLDYELANSLTPGGGINDLLSVTGNLTLGSSLTLNIDAYQGDLANGNYKLISYTGNLSGNTSGWSVGTNNASGPHSYNFSTATPGEIQLIVIDGSPIWTGATSTSWDTASNWTTGAEPSSSVNATFPTPIPGTGGSISLTSGEAAKTLVLNDNYNLSGGTLNVATGSISVASGKTATVSSVLTGTAGLSKSGAGTLVLTGSNSYSGGTTINDGTLRVVADSNLGASGGGITFNGGTLNPITGLSTSRAVTISSSGGSVDNGSGITTTLTGAIAGSAGNTLTKTGNGTLLLTQPSPRSGASSSWLGNITVSGGTLKVGNGGSTGYLPGYDPIAYAGLPPTVPTISLAAGATLEFNHGVGGATQDTTHAVVITGAGNVVITGPKTEVFVANNDYTGSTTINPGSSLRIGWGGTFNTGGLGATAVTDNGTLTFSNDHNTTFPGSVSGTGTLLKEFSSGTLTLTGDVAPMGGTTIIAGTVQVGSGGASGTIAGSIHVANISVLAFNRSDTATYAGIASGTGSISQRGTGITVLTGANTYSGGTSVTSGTLRVNNTTGSGTGTGAVTVSSGATLGGTGAISGAVTINSGAHLAPGASIESLNVGTLTLAAGSILDYELDTVAGADNSDLVNVTTASGLTINGGTLNLINAGAMTGGFYTLFDYSGALGGSVSNIALGSVPAGFTYSLTNNAANTSIQLEVTAPGDFNHDGTVDSSDYGVWRKGLGSKYTQADYDIWRANYGQTYAPGAGAGTSAVPEPAAGIFIGLATMVLLPRFGRARRLAC
jgi:autotransporter-associated beta strand protein